MHDVPLFQAQLSCRVVWIKLFALQAAGSSVESHKKAPCMAQLQTSFGVRKAQIMMSPEFASRC